MKFNFLTKNISAFGLDVSGNSLKVMEFGKQTKQLKLKGYHEAIFPKGMMANDAISDAKTFQFLIKQALEKPHFGRIDTNYVVASLPESKSFVRVIQIPQMSDSEADNAVPYEAESFIPMPIDQVYLDWEKVGDQSGEKMNILMIASPKEYVDKYLEMLDKAGLSPAAFEVESQSCLRACLPQSSQETSLLVDLGSLRSSLIMVEDGGLQFTSTIPIAGNTFTESIARALGVASAKAEEIKMKVGIANTNEYPNIKTELLPVLNNLSAEIKNILKFHAEHSQKQVSRVLISGGSSQLKNLCDFLASQLAEAGVQKVELANPWQNLNIDNALQLPGTEALGYSTAIGLAARGAEYNAN
jgi:type IV pilus assembly protein PilM